ncbi:O-acetyl-ADP-ribose deacetylase (regulator of RNase III) containing Macro domain [Methanonatronarchaeum thermophilum]|uniref:O-acetyl-ADP-ribose deacetylase (Regulator of RNase III) containing Macro domain n=1 Tax=Methanonatronarchaeum thermophilum TaxID=1927129 RepID=A0A1Y3GFL7_9EURY|nr:macro domain-containing protein [Methanonatronarchaeum thermophilum]OUJ19093.1 O-acetyl-ADP-ribose deacetylase (regulator of RNase III) containing Macro domain [Methanonatronarchaeum thermophilum]
MKIKIKKGDITQINTEAIVNPSNPYCTMGGGLAKQLLEKGGTQIKKEAIKQTPIQIGKAIVTDAGNLPSRYIIHTPTVENPTGKSSEEIISKATKAVIQKSIEKNIKTIAIPGLGTGTGKLPYEKSVKTIYKIIKQTNPDIEITFVYKNKEHGRQLKKHFKKITN